MSATKRTGASLARHKSEQTVETPPDFMDAVVRRFGQIGFDLAATLENRKATKFFSAEENSLAQRWYEIAESNLWLNCPFGRIEPWAAKCLDAIEGSNGARLFDRILLLVPASVDSNWWASYVHHKAAVKFLSPRLKFVGHKDPFPKSLALCCYGEDPGYACWRWRP